MKKFFAVFFMLTIAGAAVFANAEKPESSSAIAVMKNGAVFKLFYKASRPTDVKVSIYDSKENLVFTESLRKVDGFLRPYNFSSLPEGEYNIELIDESGRKVEKIVYKQGKVERLANLVRMAGGESKYLLTVSNRGNDVLNVRIYDAAGRTLYSGVEEINGDFAKVYNLKEVPSKYLFEITDKNGVTKTMKF